MICFTNEKKYAICVKYKHHAVSEIEIFDDWAHI
jgi:hypothetical protein